LRAGEIVQTFSERLDEHLKEKRTFLTVGLDPRPSSFPLPLKGSPPEKALKEFLWGIVDATRDHCVAYKMQFASYIAFGLEGVSLLPELAKHVGRSHITILDIKAGDIPATMELYRSGIFGRFGFDAMTIHPFLGWDSVEAALTDTGKGAFVLLHTSNAGAVDVQGVKTASGVELWRTLMPKVRQLSAKGNLGAVVGATFPEALAEARAALGPSVPLLVPGVGAQGATVEQVMSGGIGGSGGALLVNSSRGILYASSGDDWKEAAGKEARALTQQMRESLRSVPGRASPAGPQPR
jgi:orotidine-5'-phosphate decarboxylase